MDSRNKKHADDCLRVVTKVVGTITEKGEEVEEGSGQGARISSKRQNILVRNNWTNNYLQVVIFF